MSAEVSGDIGACPAGTGSPASRAEVGRLGATVSVVPERGASGESTRFRAEQDGIGIASPIGPAGLGEARAM